MFVGGDYSRRQEYLRAKYYRYVVLVFTLKDLGQRPELRALMAVVANGDTQDTCALG